MDNLAADFEINPNNPLNAEYELGEGVGFDCSFELFAAGTVWGSIDGDINNQTDLINLLNTKVDLTSFEELSQTVTNNYNELTGDIADLTTTVTDNYNTLRGQISDLNTTVDNNYTSLDNRLTTAEGSILDLTDTVNDNYTELNGKITTTNNNLSTLNKTVEDNNTAINNRVDGIVESFDGDISDLNNAVDNLSDTVTNNYTDLNGRITVNTDNIATIQNTINSYGDIVSYNAAYFATANQGALADTSLQPNDNITLLNNNAGYITSADIPTLEDITTTAQLNAINSGATNTNIGQITINQNNIADIRALIPLQASTSNQLADKGFVNSSISTNTAYFIGTFNSVAELEAYSGTLTNNDYAFVATTDSAGNTLYDRYKYNADTQQWNFEYELNNSSFTAQQWASINSGITSGDVTLIGTALQPNDNISELINDAGYITSADLPTNYVTTDTVQNISGRKTFLGEKAIYFKQNTTSDKLGFTLYNPSSTELGALEWRPNTINGNALLALNCSQTGSNYVGFRYWSGINIVAPRPTTNGNYFIPVNVTDGTNTVTANNNGTLNISSLLPDISDMATQTWVTSQGYTTNVGTVTSVNNTQPDANGNVTLVIPDTATWGNITGTLSDQTDLQNALNAKQNTISDLSTIRSGASLGATALQPNDNITELVNNAGYITGITSSDVTTALGYTPYNSTNPSGYITASALTGYATETYVDTGLATKQATLVSGTNIKTINNNSILGSGNLTLDGLPSQTGQAGKFLTTDGIDSSWATVTIPTPTYDSTNERITW